MFFKEIKKPNKENISDYVEISGEQRRLEIIFSKRKTISIEVHPDGAIKVRSPNRTSVKHIYNNLRDREGWIAEKLKQFESQRNNLVGKFNYQDGDRFFYLGNIYELKIIEDLASKFEVVSNVLELRTPYKKPDKIKKMFDDWFRIVAKKIILDRLEICKIIAMDRIGIKYSDTPVFRKMKRRWGSCDSKGKITFNYELGRVNLNEIDYVILHEICHLKEMNHGKGFYNLMNKTMPDWKTHRNSLKKHFL